MDAPSTPLAAPPVIAPPALLPYHNPDLPEPPPHWTNVSLHTADPSRYWPFFWRGLGWRLLPGVVAYSVAAIFWAFLFPTGLSLVFVAEFTGIIVAMLAFKVVRYAFQFRREFRTARYLAADQGVQRVVPGYPVFQVHYVEVTKAHQLPVGLVLKAGSMHRTLVVPALLFGYDRIVEQASRAVTVKLIRRAALRSLGRVGLILLLVALYLSTFYGVLLTQRPWLELLFACAFAGVAGWSVYTVIRSPNIKLLSKILTPTFTALMLLLILVKIVITHFSY